MVVEVELAQMRSLIFSLRAVVEVEEVLWNVVEEVLWDVLAEVAEWVMEQALIGYFEVI